MDDDADCWHPRRRSGSRESNLPLVVIGAHLDSVDTPGGNDNASGLAVLLECAGGLDQAAADFRFVTFGAEEIGLVGSARYVAGLTADERDRFAGAIILDSVGRGSLLEVCRAVGHPEHWPRRRLGCLRVCTATALALLANSFGSRG